MPRKQRRYRGPGSYKSTHCGSVTLKNEIPDELADEKKDSAATVGPKTLGALAASVLLSLPDFIQDKFQIGTPQGDSKEQLRLFAHSFKFTKLQAELETIGKLRITNNDRIVLIRSGYLGGIAAAFAGFKHIDEFEDRIDDDVHGKLLSVVNFNHAVVSDRDIKHTLHNDVSAQRIVSVITNGSVLFFQPPSAYRRDAIESMLYLKFVESVVLLAKQEKKVCTIAFLSTAIISNKRIADDRKNETAKVNSDFIMGHLMGGGDKNNLHTVSILLQNNTSGCLYIIYINEPSDSLEARINQARQVLFQHRPRSFYLSRKARLNNKNMITIPDVIQPIPRSRRRLASGLQRQAKKRQQRT